ncbi:MAG TPA: tetratricopeptide repeat protein [Elusimicrobiales bacterium]|nr:tetratricopeptide repeat protein [Elusimicrobiales bacterium]
MASVFLGALGAPARAIDSDAAKHFMQGLLLENSGKDSEALEEFKKALQLDKDAIYIYRHAAKTALRSGDYLQALAWAEQLTRVEPSNADNWTLLGGISWAGRDPDAARRAFEKALELSPDSVNALYQAANMLGMLDPDKSVEYLKRLIKLRPQNLPEIHYRLALVLYKLGKTEEAAENLRLAIQAEPDYLEARYMLAQFYEAKGSTEAALSTYIAAVERDSKNAAVLTHIGGMLLASEKDAEAQIYFERARAADRGNHGANFGLAMLAEKRGDFLGVANYLRGSDSYSRDPALWVRASYYLSQAGALSEAVNNLGQAHAKWPDNPEITYFYALGLDDSGQTDKALELVEGLLRSNPDYRDAKLQYAVLCERSGKIAEAEKAFRELIAKKPEDAYALNYLGYMLADRGLKLEEARAFILRAVALEPENGAYLDSLGWADFKLGRVSQASDSLRKAARMVNADPAIWEHLGEVFSYSGNNAGAWFCFKISQALSPDRGLDKKIAVLEKKLRPEELARGYARYLDARYGGYRSFSALCKITVKAGLREFYFDGILRYKPDGGINLDFLGPMFTPVWTLRLEGEAGGVEISDPDFLPEPAAELRPFAEAVLSLLKHHYSGVFADDNGWALSGNSLHRRDIKAELSSNKSGLEKLSGVGGKTTLSILSVERQDSKLVPTALLLKGALSVRVNMTQWTAEFTRRSIEVPE